MSEQSINSGFGGGANARSLSVSDRLGTSVAISDRNNKSTRKQKRAQSTAQASAAADLLSKKDAAPKKKTSPPCCTVPLAVVFGAACVTMALVFTLITLVTTLAFTSEVNSSVESTLGTAMQGAMKYVTDPLLKSQQYVKQLTVMVESGPLRMGCDDSVPAFPGNTSTTNFLYEIGMYALQRTDIQNVYQSRLSKRYLKPDGSGPAGICCLIAPQQRYAHLFANNTQTVAPFTNGSFFENLATQVHDPPRAVDITQLAVLRGAVATNTSRWVSDSINIAAAGLSEPANKYTYFLRISDETDPGGVWAVGIDHNMQDLKSLLLQATPPISVGRSDIVPSQVSGAHTTLYDLNEQLVMASTHPDVPVAKAYGVLFPMGESPSPLVNDAFNQAISKCGDSGCLEAVVTIGNSFVHTAYRINIPSAALHLMMVSSVPRDYFFADADRTFGVTLGISVGSCVFIILGCIALLLMIYRPLNSLQDNMYLAAELHNDRVCYTHTYLRDIAALSAVFDAMNQQLLIARSFVPEAVLLNKVTDDDDDHEDGCDEEGSVSDAGTSLRMSRSRVSKEGTTIVESSVQNSSRASSVGMAKLFNIAEKRVGVLSLNLVGFHAICVPDRSGTRAQKIHGVSTALLTLAVSCAHEERGVLDSFHGDHFTVTFNASRVVSGPLAAAVRAANNFIMHVQEDSTFDGSAGVAAGAASGRAQVGTFGIDGYRRLSVIGEVYRTATALQNASTQLIRMAGDGFAMREGCLVEEASLKELGSCAFYLQMVGCIQSAQHRLPTPKGSVLSKPTIAYYAIDASLSASARVHEADGEWLYELDAIASSDPFLEPNRAMLALLHGDITVCEELVQARNETLLTSGSPRLSLAVQEGGSLEDSITQISKTGGETCSEWQMVRRNLEHHKRTLATFTNDTNNNIVSSFTERCPLPWVMFQQ